MDGEIFGEVGSRSSALVVDDDLTMASNDPLDGRLGYIGWSDLRSFEAGGQIGVDEPAVDADHLDTPGSDTKTPGGSGVTRVRPGERSATCHQAWIATEHAELARAYERTRQEVAGVVGPAIAEAWNTGPACKPGQMNLGAWGPTAACQEALAGLQGEIENRFGVRRLKAAWNRRRLGR